MNRRTFDLVLSVSLLTHAAIPLVRLVGRRWAREESGPQQLVGQAIAVAL